MLALVFDGALRLEREYPAPRPGPEEALVRVVTAGICNTDQELVRGYMGFQGVLGHEFVGVAAEGPLAGRRLCGEINLSCRACPTCLQGMETQCPHRTTLGIFRKDGAFAEWLTLPAANLHPVPDSVSDEQAVFTEPLAAALQMLHLQHVSPRDRVVLIGAGKLGLLAAQVLALTGCSLTAVARHERQRRLLRGWGIDAAAPGEVDPKEADTVVDCTGSPDGFTAALELVRPQGTIHLKSTYQGLPPADLTRAVVDEVRIVTSRCGPFPPALRLLARGLVDVESLIDARLPLERGLEAFARAAGPGALKVLLEVEPR